MKICIDMGHTPASPGASGYIDELEKDRMLGERLKTELVRRGHDVYDSTPEDWVSYPDEVNERVAYEHANGPFDLFVSLHFNAFNGDAYGTEVLYWHQDSHGSEVASIISDNLSRALGTYNRGAKGNDWVGVIANTWSTAVLIETCFCDNWDDCCKWWDTPWDDIIGAIADGIEERRWEKPADLDYEPQPEPVEEEHPKHGQDPAPDVDPSILAAGAYNQLLERVERIENTDVAQIVIDEILRRLAH